MLGFTRHETQEETQWSDVDDQTGLVVSPSDTGARTGVSGFIYGTRVATSKGWCPAENVVAGDSVLTFDAGLQKITGITHRRLWAAGNPCPKHLWPILMPEGAIGNIQEMLLLPDQIVMLESDAAHMLFGDRYAALTAKSLLGWRGLRRVIPHSAIVVTNIWFDQNQIVLANAGLQFLCPERATQTETSDVSDGAQISTDHILSEDQARALVRHLAFDDAQSAPVRKIAGHARGPYAAFAA